jgi:hypothetical protein
MLNELYELSNALKKANIATRDWYKNFKLLPKGGGFIFRVLIDKEARVSDVTIEEFSLLLRKWEKANGKSFPAFNISPLVLVKMESKKMLEILKEHKRSTVLDLIKNGKFDWRNESSRINDCLQEVSKEFSKRIGTNIPNEMSALNELFRRAEHISNAAQNRKGANKQCVFLEQLRDVLIEKIISAGTNPEKFAELLFVPKEKENPPKLNVLLELADATRFPYPANHPKVQEWINEQLLANTTNSDKSDLKQKDAFGNAGIGEDKMPPTKIEVLGKVTLRSMSSESPCQYRYGHANADSYPIGERTRRDLKAALETITKSEWKGRTWASFGGKEMLIAYPFSLPPEPPALVAMFGGAQSEGDPQDARFSIAAQGVAQAYKTGISAEADNVSVFLLKKPDGYRTKVANGGTYTASYILAQADAWERASQNIPFMRIKNWNPEKKPTWFVMETPFPLEIVSCLNTQWLKFGHEAIDKVKRYGASDAIDLLLREGGPKRQIASRMLVEGLQKWTPLFLGLGQACHQGEILKGPLSWQWRIIPPAMGIFLEKLGLKKEIYMLEAAYLVGQTLGLADSLHYQYCLKVRNQSAPPQLMGNGLMATALENPGRALALLAQRILPYQAWARTYNGPDAGLSKWFLRKFSETSITLSKVSWPERMGDADKAQMLLGYLAGFPKEDEAQEKKV